jgi:hypothetical protein
MSKVGKVEILQRSAVVLGYPDDSFGGGSVTNANPLANSLAFSKSIPSHPAVWTGNNRGMEQPPLESRNQSF